MPVNKRTLLNVIVIFLFLLQIGINLYSYGQIQHLVAANKKVSHTQQIIYSISDLWSKTLEMQMHLKGFVITGDANYLNSYRQASDTIFLQIKHLQDLTKTNARQISSLKKLPLLLKERLNFYEEVIAIYKNKGEEEAEKTIADDPGILATNQIREITNQMHEEEIHLLEARNQKLHKNTAMVNTYLIFTNIVTFLLTLLFLYLFNLQYSHTLQANRRRKVVESQLQGIIKGTQDSIAAIDRQGNLLIFNRAFEKDFLTLFGQSIALGDNVAKLLAHVPQEQKILMALWDKALKGQEFTITHEMGDAKHVRKTYEITYSTIHSNHGELLGASQISRDVSQRISMEKAMASTNAQLSQGLLDIQQHNQAISQLSQLTSTLQSCLTEEETFDPIAIYSHKILPWCAGILYLAHSTKNYMAHAVEWQSPITVEKIISPEQCWALRRGQIHRYYNSEHTICCGHVKNNTGVSSLCIPMQAQNESVGLLYLELRLDVQISTEKEFNDFINQQELLIISLAEAIALSLANIKLRETLRIRSIRDPLTGLYNRSYLEESFAREISRAQRQNTKMAAVMIDLDHFKKINDNYGHEAGDLVLVEVTKLLSRKLRQSDIACRYGGEEILLLLLDITTIEGVYQRIDELRQDISQLTLIFHGQALVSITASFGIAISRNRDENQAQLIERADQALYQSKNEGRNRVTLAAELD